MTDSLLRDIEYNTTKALEAFERIKDIKKTFYDVPREPLTIEETYVLRDQLMNVQIHLEMTRNDLIWHTNVTKKDSKLKKLFRK